MVMKVGPVELPSTDHPVDFARTEILVSGSAPADGISGLGVVIHLKNSDNTPVSNYKPEYQVVAGVGVLPGECSTSDSNGVSACAVRATQAGTKTVRLVNAKVGLEKNLSFVPPVYSSSRLSLGDGGIRSSTASGYTVKTTAAVTVTGVQATTAAGYMAKISIQTDGN